MKKKQKQKKNVKRKDAFESNLEYGCILTFRHRNNVYSHCKFMGNLYTMDELLLMFNCA